MSHSYQVSLPLNGNCRSVKIYGRADQRQTLEPLLVWATPGQRGFGPPPSQRSNVPAVQTHAAPAYTSCRDPYSAPHTTLASTSYHDPYSIPRKTYAPVLTPTQEAAQKKLAEDMKKAGELRQILDNLEKVNDEGRRASLLDQLLSTDDVLMLPEHPNPPGISAGNLTVDLLKHQVWVRPRCQNSQHADIYTETSIALVY